MNCSECVMPHFSQALFSPRYIHGCNYLHRMIDATTCKTLICWETYIQTYINHWTNRRCGQWFITFEPRFSVALLVASFVYCKMNRMRKDLQSKVLSNWIVKQLIESSFFVSRNLSILSKVQHCWDGLQVLNHADLTVTGCFHLKLLGLEKQSICLTLGLYSMERFRKGEILHLTQQTRFTSTLSLSTCGLLERSAPEGLRA